MLPEESAGCGRLRRLDAGQVFCQIVFLRIPLRRVEPAWRSARAGNTAPFSRALSFKSSLIAVSALTCCEPVLSPRRSLILLRQSFEQSGAGNPRPENLPLLTAHANDFAFAATLQTSHARGHAQTGRKRTPPLPGLRRAPWVFARAFQRSLRAGRDSEASRQDSGSRTRVSITLVLVMDMDIDQERQTLPGLAALQAKLRAFSDPLPSRPT